MKISDRARLYGISHKDARMERQGAEIDGHRLAVGKSHIEKMPVHHFLALLNKEQRHIESNNLGSLLIQGSGFRSSTV